MLKYFHDASGNIRSELSDGLSPPQITGQPVEQVIEPGNIVPFSGVVADARAATFQWKFNDTGIPGAAGDSLLLTNVSTDDEGQYSVAVTKIAGSVISAVAAMTLDSDCDGLPDSLEIGKFSNATSKRSASNPDGDGIQNFDEFLDDTEPQFRHIAFAVDCLQ